MKKSLSLLLCFVGVLLMTTIGNIGCGGGGGDSGSAQITLAKYNEIQNGMSFQQVSAILTPASIGSNISSGNIRIVVWGDQASDTIVSVTFVNDQVTDKTKNDKVV